MGYDIGPRIGIEGEAEFKNAVKAINENFKTLKTEMQAVTSAYDRNDKSVQNLSSQNMVLTKQIDSQKSKLIGLNTALEKSIKANGENSAATQKLKQDINSATTVMNKAELQIKDNEKALKNHNSEVFKTTLKTEEMQKAQERLRGVMNSLKVAVAAVTGVLVYSGKEAIDYEDAFAGVRKTVKATDEELSKMSYGIREMSKTTPVAATELAGIASNAGQLGIQTGKILDFTKVMADLGVATNLTGEEAAQTFAKFANITKMSQDEFNNLGSTIVELGNNTATTEADISAMALRLAAAGSQSNISRANIIGMAATLSSLGVEAEAGGSAFSKLINEMNASVQTGKGLLGDFAAVSGMTSMEFQKAFKENAAGAITSFINGLGKAGSKAVVLLDAMDIKEVRMRDSILRTAGAGDLLNKTLNMSTQAWMQNSALTTEAEEKYKTTASQLQLLKNTFTDAAIEVGNQLIPQIQNLTASLKDADLTPIINSLKWIIDNSGVIISAAVGIGAGMITWNIAQTVFAVIQAVQVWKGAMDAAKLSQLGLNAAMASNPIGLAITLVATLAAGLGVYALMSGKAKTASQELWEETEELIDSTSDLRMEYDDFKKTIDDKTSSHISEIEAAKKLIPELETLTGKTERTKEENIRLESIISQLNKVMPDLKLAVDNQTGALNRQIGVIYAAADAYIALAKAQAYKDIVTDTQKKVIELSDQRKELIDKGGKDAAIYLEARQKALEKNVPLANILMNDYGMSEDEAFSLSPADFSETNKQITELTDTINEAEAKTKRLTDEATKLQAENQGVVDSLKDTTTANKDLGASYADTEKKASSSSNAETEAAKKAEKAAKEAAEAAEKARDKDFKNLKYMLDMGEITEEQYYIRLGWKRDAYFAKGSEEWQNYTVEIHNFYKKSFEEVEKEIKKNYEDIAKSAIEKIDEVKKAQDGLQTKLNNYAKLFKTVKFTGGEKTEEFASLGNLKKANEELQNYSDLLKAVKARGAGDELFSILRDMDPAEATKNAKLLMSKTDEEFNAFINDLKSNRDLNKTISKDLYSDDMSNALAEGVQSAIDGLSKMTSDYANLGSEYAKAIGDGFNEAMKSIKLDLGEELKSLMSGLNISVGGDGIRVSPAVASSTSTTYSPTIQMYGKPQTASEAFNAATRQYRIDIFRGLTK